jgi:hypothetical protein
MATNRNDSECAIRFDSRFASRHSGNFQWTHNYTLRQISRAMIVPEVIIAIRKSQLLTAN